MTIIATATICHSEDDHRDQNHRRITLTCSQEGDRLVWRDEDGNEVADTAGGKLNVNDALQTLQWSFGDPVWALQVN